MDDIQSEDSTSIPGSTSGTNRLTDGLGRKQGEQMNSLPRRSPNREPNEDEISSEAAVDDDGQVDAPTEVEINLLMDNLGE